MALPKREDGSLNWQRIRNTDVKTWHLSDSEYRIMIQKQREKEYEAIKEGRPVLLLENLDGLGQSLDVSGPMQRSFNEILEKHHPDGFDPHSGEDDY